MFYINNIQKNKLRRGLECKINSSDYIEKNMLFIAGDVETRRKYTLRFAEVLL